MSIVIPLTNVFRKETGNEGCALSLSCVPRTSPTFLARAFKRYGRNCGNGNIAVTHYNSSSQDISAIWPSYTGTNYRPFIGYFRYNSGAYLYCDGKFAIRVWPYAYARTWNVYVATVVEHTRIKNGTSENVSGGWGKERRGWNYYTSYWWYEYDWFNKPYFTPEEIISLFLSSAIDSPGSPIWEALGQSSRIDQSYGIFGNAPTNRGPHTNVSTATIANIWYKMGQDLVRHDDLPIRWSPAGESMLVEGFVRLYTLPYLNDCMSLALVDCYDSLPEQATNLVASIIDTVNLLSSAMEGLTSAGANVVQDAWLSYRYSYNTTKLDIEEMVKLIERLQRLTSLTFKCHGLATRTYQYSDDHGVMRQMTITSRVTGEFFSSEFLPSSLLEKVEKAGLRLNAYNAWDLIPFSFIVDWFLPVQELTQAMDAAYSDFYRYKSRKWTTSVKVDFADSEGAYSTYCRCVGYKPNIALTSAFSGVRSKPGSTTLWYHAADALSIFVRR